MIKFSLKCGADHRFESWFQSSEAFETLSRTGHLTCPECGSTDIQKAIMAPRVAPKTVSKPEAEKPVPVAAQPPAEIEKAIAELRKKVEANSEYVGDQFAKEARAIHDGETPERAIHGEARPEDARALIEDGIEVLPLPFATKRKMQ